jgi:hypothetical protein
MGKRLIVRYLGDDKKVSVLATDEMSEEDAEAERKRIQKEHTDAGAANVWIDIGGHSIQSRQIQSISIDDPPSSGASFGF